MSGKTTLDFTPNTPFQRVYKHMVLEFVSASLIRWATVNTYYSVKSEEDGTSRLVHTVSHINTFMIVLVRNFDYLFSQTSKILIQLQHAIATLPDDSRLRLPLVAILKRRFILATNRRGFSIVL